MPLARAILTISRSAWTCTRRLRRPILRSRYDHTYWEPKSAPSRIIRVNASYVERLNIVRELLDVQGTVANAWDAGWFIDDGRDLWNGIANPPAPPRSIVFEGRTILRLAPTPDEISMAIGARWKMFRLRLAGDSTASGGGEPPGQSVVAPAAAW